jgi:hypothetical protein
MAAAYITCIAIRHPFVDGNKRTALAAALAFMDENGYQVQENRENELADLVIDFLTTELDKDDIAQYLRDHAQKYRLIRACMTSTDKLIPLSLPLPYFLIPIVEYLINSPLIHGGFNKQATIRPTFSQIEIQ